MLQAASKVHEIVSGTLTPAEKLDAAQAEFGKLAEATTRRESASIRDALKRYVDDLDRRARGEAKNPGIPTGLVDLDRVLNGGIRRGALVTIGARPGMGKSALGETIALNAAMSGYGVLFLSMEMPESEVTERAIANVGRVSVSALALAEERMGQTGNWAGVTRASRMLQDTNLHIDDEPGLSMLQVASKARAIKRRHGLDLLVVDYLQLMVGTKEKRHEQIEEITRNLKILAKVLNCAVLALSQFSREIEKRPVKRPILSDFRDGGSIEQDSDILMGLYREEQDNPDTDNKGYSELFVMKNRQGRPARISLTYLGEQMRFENFTGDVPVLRSIKPHHQGFKD
jgi:replicative DNA helicase